MLISAFVFAALAVALIFPSSTAQLSRLGTGAKTKLPKWLAGREDAPALQTRVAIGLGAGVCLLIALPGVIGVALGFLVVIGCVLALGHMETGARRTYRQKMLLQQPIALTFLAASLRAGSPLRVATAEVSEISPTETAKFLAGINARISVGATEAEAWRSVRDHDSWGEIARDIARAAANGTMLADLLDTHAEEAKEKFFTIRQTAAKKIGVKVALPMMCCFLPSFICIGVAPIVASLLEGFLR